MFQKREEIDNNNINMTAVARLRELLAQEDKIVVCPGVYDGFTARIALSAGFDCLYMTGAGTTMSKLGMADLGIATLNDMRENAGMISSLDRRIPVIADADTGFGGPLMVGRTIEQYMQAGVAALHLEDQVVNKRCGHLSNKEIVDEETYITRIRAAVNARAQTHGDIVIIARTDALQSLGYEAAVSRLKKAIAIGADVAFLEGFTSVEEGRRVCAELAPTPVLLNMVAGGVTPNFTVAEAKEAGFRIIIYAAFALGPVFGAVSAAAKELKETGDLKAADLDGKRPRDIFTVCGLNEAIAFDVAAGGKLYAKGV
ncbi:Carboxyvinyl-carboxyphosphonate phosphorylmutase [Lachnellula hyalina]|uniref:Carboxyvinyl-carboxyphosphonate phosphorylmutase n=1 Tax=Lachnellula hyalina TaxID=1316788 RepID=A0A8H8R2A3_9HELO|nr:Carboxyvinyl-carboxyphosphonate phosphorylmutase [Lachnellula hyalina]TVY27123.1 Carboxyvinyl-carboxyphosphonate phosphorylmutase [Lachnellula hyalina]